MSAPVFTPVTGTLPRPSQSQPKTYEYHFKSLFPDNLAERQGQLAALPIELCPPSPTPEMDHARVELTRAFVRTKVAAAQGNPTNQRWAHVHSTTKLGCVNSSWYGVGRRVDVGLEEDGFEWFLAETEEEYAQWEQRQAKRRAVKRPRITQQDTFPADGEQGHPSSNGAVGGSNTQQSEVPSQVLKSSTKSAQLNFPVSKHGSQTSKKKPQDKNLNRHRLSSRFSGQPISTSGSSTSVVPASSQPNMQDPDKTHEITSPRISQVSEIYLAPSFRTGVVHSTPPREIPEKTKPPVIPSSSNPFPASLESPPPFEESQPASYAAAHPAAPPFPPPPLVDVQESAPSQNKDSYEEARIYVPSNPSNKAPTPTPLTPVSSPPRPSVALPTAQSPEDISPPGLGNVLGAFPTDYTGPGGVNDKSAPQVLATSQRSQPRPRPPSRSGSRAGGTFNPLLTPEQASGPKTYFSSPASESPASPLAGIHLSPQSPLDNYTAYPSSRSSSTQNDNSAAKYADFAYSSQYDVETQIGRISGMLENDVDFTQWVQDHESPPPGAD